MIVTAGFFYLFAALTIASGFMVIASLSLPSAAPTGRRVRSASS